jgi:hypothetical protein
MTARRFEALLLGLALGAVLMMLARSQDFGRLSRDLAAAEDSIAVLVPKIAQLEAQADSAGNVAHRADTVRVEVERVVRVEVDHSRERAQAAADSLRATLDSVQALQLANVETSHRAEVAALERIADERLAWGTAWRDYAIAGDSLAQAQSAQIALKDVVSNGLRQAARRQAITNKVTQAVAVAGAGKVCYDAVNAGQTGLAVGSCAVAVWAAARP